MKIIVDLVKNPFFQMVWKEPGKILQKGSFFPGFPPLFLDLLSPCVWEAIFGILKQVTRRFQHTMTAAPAKTPRSKVF